MNKTGLYLLCVFSYIMSKVWVSRQVLYCHMHNNYSEAFIGNEILNSQAPSNNAQAINIKRTSRK